MSQRLRFDGGGATRQGSTGGEVSGRMKKRAGDTEGILPMAASSAANMKTKKMKKKSAADAAGAGICDDVLDNIFARLPARTAVASMVLSKHHHALIRSAEFRSLDFRLSPPLPDPHIAYISEIHGFHVAGAGHNSDAPMRTLDGILFCKDMKFINTCNGILLFARESETASRSPACVLWNPAVADGKREFTVPHYTRKPDDHRRIEAICNDDPGDYSILGLGYGERSKSYKLLLTYRQKELWVLDTDPPQSTYCKELLVYTLGAVGETPRLVKLLSQLTMDIKISQESLCIDGVVLSSFQQNNGPCF